MSFYFNDIMYFTLYSICKQEFISYICIVGYKWFCLLSKTLVYLRYTSSSHADQSNQRDIFYVIDRTVQMMW